MEKVDGKPSLGKSLRFKTMATAGGGLLGYALGTYKSSSPEIRQSVLEYGAGTVLLTYSATELMMDSKDHPRPFIHKLISHIGVIAGGALMGAGVAGIPGAVIGGLVTESLMLLALQIKGRNRINPVPHTL